MDQNANDHVKFDEGHTDYSAMNAPQKPDLATSLSASLGISRSTAAGLLVVFSVLLLLGSAFLYYRTKTSDKPQPTPADIQALEDSLRVNH